MTYYSHWVFIISVILLLLGTYFNQFILILAIFGFALTFILIGADWDTFREKRTIKAQQIAEENRNRELKLKEEAEQKKIRAFKKSNDYILITKLIEKHPNRFNDWAPQNNFFYITNLDLIDPLKSVLASKGYDLDDDLIIKIIKDAKMNDEYVAYKSIMETKSHHSVYDLVKFHKFVFPEETKESKILLNLSLEANSIYINNVELQEVILKVDNDNFESSLLR